MNEGRPGGFRQFHLDQVMADGAATFVARQLPKKSPSRSNMTASAMPSSWRRLRTCSISRVASL